MPKSMQENEQQYTPTAVGTVGLVTQNPKRKCNETSPEICTQMINITKNDLIETMSTLLDEKLKNLPTKNDFLEIKENVNEIKSDVSRLENENSTLKDELKQLRESQEKDRRRLQQIEEDLSRKKLIVRGIASQRSAYHAIKKMCKDNLKINHAVDIESAKKIYDKDQKMTVLVEFKSVGAVSEILKHAKNLAGSSISIDRDLCKERLQNKKVMLQLRKDILKADNSKRVGVKGDKLVVDGKIFAWNSKRILMCGQSEGLEVLQNIYGDIILNVSLEYNSILEQINSKNL